MDHRARCLMLAASSICALAICPWLGAADVSPADVFGGGDGLGARIFWTLRVPRTMLAWCTGATFGVCGAAFQALFRNPLAEPSLLGISSGAALGAAASIRFGLASGSLAAFSMPACAFVGAICATAIITAFARASRSPSDASLLLAGVALGAICSSVIMIFQYTGGATETFRLISWTMGGVGAVGASDALYGAAPMAIALLAAAASSRELDIMTFGDEIAASRGVSPEKTRRALFVMMSLAVAAIVSKCGPIGFVGLIAPHVARAISGPRHLPLTFASAVVGGTLLLVCDTVARTVWTPIDLPVGIIISALGAPFFLWLLSARRG